MSYTGMNCRERTSYLVQLLCEHHVTKWGEWATFAELMEAPAGGQRLDFFAVHTWRSKNYRAVAYEIKVSRSDFLREMRDPYKRAFAERVSHECYFVAPPGLISSEEVPFPWGLMQSIPGTRSLEIVKRCERRVLVTWPMSFSVSIARRAADVLPTQLELLELS